MSVSLDGYVAGPDQSLEHPLGRRGIDLHHWHLDEPLNEADRRARDLLLRPRGAYVMGRNMFGPIRGPWQDDWRGWWGDDPPYHAPVFVLTHHNHAPIEMAGGTIFHFVTEGFDAAFARASEAAGDRGVDIAGGASTVRQALATLEELTEEQIRSGAMFLSVLTSVLEIHIHRGELEQAQRLYSLFSRLETSVDLQEQGIYRSATAALRRAE